MPPSTRSQPCFVYGSSTPPIAHAPKASLAFVRRKLGNSGETTEGDEQYDYGYLEGDWERGKHRKWCGVLTKDQFNEFVQSTGLFADSTQTMGSLGAPGFGFGWSPAISFRDDGGRRAVLNAYVTPIPETSKESLDERDWKRVRRAVLNIFGDN